MDMAKTKIKKKTAHRVTPEVKARIVELSLQHPEFGAKRLIPLLSSENIAVSVSTVYSVLKRKGLSSREKRVSKLSEQTHNRRRPAAKKKSTRISGEVAGRIVQVSLQKPEYGARRLLPLLANEKILLPVSTVNSVLRRNGLQNRDKRFARIEARRAFATPSPEGIEMQLPPAIQAPTPAELPALVSEHPVAKDQPPRRLPIPSITQRAVTGRPWFITLINSVLVFLIVVLGFHTWHNVSQAHLEPDLAALTPPASGVVATKPDPAPAPLSEFRMISKRNLFNESKLKEPEPPKATPVEKLAPAQKELGLQLVGTVVAYDSRLSRAFINNRRTRKQEIYSEGNKAVDVRIKKIMRNKVIIATKEGDRLLTVDFRGTSESSNPATYAQQKAAGGEYPQQIAGRKRPGRSITLAHAEVEASLADIGTLEQQLKIEPYEKDYQPAGFTISGIPQQSILRKMGFKNGNAIMGVNDMAIMSPDQASEFFQTLAEGGEKTVKVRIGRGVRRRTRWLHLNIE